jgi:hypothetical protein
VLTEQVDETAAPLHAGGFSFDGGGNNELGGEHLRPEF